MIIYTDGSFNRELNIGSWGFIRLNDNKTKIKYAKTGIISSKNVNSTRAELKGVIESLKYCISIPGIHQVFVDHEPIVVKFSQETRRNIDLWSNEFYDLRDKLNDRISMKWVKSHGHDRGNEYIHNLVKLEMIRELIRLGK